MSIRSPKPVAEKPGSPESSTCAENPPPHQSEFKSRYRACCWAASSSAECASTGANCATSRRTLTSSRAASHMSCRYSACAGPGIGAVSYTHLRAHETDSYLVCRLLLEKKKKTTT